MADNNNWQTPEPGEEGEGPKLVTLPLTITEMLQNAAEPQPLQGTSLGLLMNDQEMADAGIALGSQPGQTGPTIASNDGPAYDGLCRLPDGSVHAYTDAGGGYVNIYGDGNADSSGQAGIGAAANGTAMPTMPKPGEIAGGGRSGPVTSPASSAGRGLTGGARSDALKPITGTSSVGGSIGRAIPFLGVPLMLDDFYQHQTAPDCVPVPDPTAIY